MLDFRIENEIDVRDLAVGRDVRLARRHEGLIGLAERPAIGKRSGQRGIGGIANGTRAVQPGEQIGLIVVGQPAIVRPRRVFALRRRGREPRRHRALVHDLANHPGVRRDIFDRFQFERGDSARAMTFNTIRLHDPRDAVVVRHVFGRLRQVIPFQFTARCRCRGGCNGSAREQCGDGFREERLLGCGELITQAVLIIHGPTINDGSLGIEENHFGRRSGTERLGQFGAVNVLALQAVRRLKHADRFDGIRGDRVDEQERYALRGIVRFEFGERRAVLLRDGTTRAGQADGQTFFADERCQGDCTFWMSVRSDSASSGRRPSLPHGGRRGLL